jgi:hypothetical protein
MSPYSLTDLPQQVLLPEYESAVDALKDHISAQPGFVSFYSIGGVSAPGISDLDVLVVWEDGTFHKSDLRPLHSVFGKYLFIHSLYGTTPGLFKEALHFTCYAPSRLLAGQQLHVTTETTVIDPTVRRQISIEYLLRLFVGLHLQHLQGMLRVRSILLNANGISSDLAVLFPGNQDAARMMNGLARLRSEWFSGTPPLNEFRDWFSDFHPWIGSALTSLLDAKELHLPENKSYRLGRNIRLEQSDRTSFPSSFFQLPFIRPFVGRRYPNMLNRLNRPVFRMPYASFDHPEPMRAYFDFTRRHREYNRMYLPAYLPLTGSLQLT